MQIQYNLYLLLFCYFLDVICEPPLKRRCLNEFECFDKGVEQCSVCVDDDDGKDGQCIYIYPETYEHSPSCTKRLSCSLDCSHRGRCLTTMVLEGVVRHFHPFCRCSPGNYGESCQYISSGKSATFEYVNKLFNGGISACQPSSIQFSFSSSKEMENSNIDFYFKFDRKSFQKYSKSMLRRSKIFSHFYAEVDVKVVFPYRKASFKLGSDYIGYVARVYAQVYVDGNIAFSDSWDQFVKYGDLKCLPKITTSNCADDMSSTAEFLRSHRVALHIDVEYVYDGRKTFTNANDPQCKVSEIMFWQISKLNRGRSLNFRDYTNHTRSKSITFDPYKLQIGTYEVEIMVSNVEMENPITNVAYCYFKIACTPLVAKIVGGSDRVVPANLGLTLRATGSYDPNMPSSDQGQVKMEWTCVNMLRPELNDSFCAEKKILVVSQNYQVPSEILTPGSIYNFTLKVWTDRYDQRSDCGRSDISPQFASLVVRVAPSGDPESENIEIHCLENCKRKVLVTNKLILKAIKPNKPDESLNTTYEWSYYIDYEEGNLKNLDKIGEMRSYFLKIQENRLQPDKNYTIMVRMSNSTWYAKYKFETYNIDFEVNCSLAPGFGTKGQTVFNIACTVIKNPSKGTLTYEFYNKNEEEKLEAFIFSGRMLGTSKEGRLSNIYLTREHLMIYIFRKSGLCLEKHIKVDLLDWKITDEILVKLYQNVRNKIQFGSLPSVLGAISFIPDVIPVERNKKKIGILETLLGFLTHLSYNSLEDIKLSLSTLSNVLISMNNPNQLQLDPFYAAKTLRMIKQLAGVFTRSITSSHREDFYTTREVKQIAATFLNCLQVVVLSRDKQTESIQEGAVHFSLLRELQEGSSSAESVIDEISNTLAYFQVPGQPVTRVASKNESLKVWVVTKGAHDDFNQLIQNESEIPISISDKMDDYMNQMINSNEVLTLKVVSMKENIFWWSFSEVRSGLVSVSINRQYDKRHFFPIHNLDRPMEILITLDGNLQTTKIEDSAIMVESGEDQVILDSAVKVHRFDPPLRSLITITFLYPPTNGSLRVLVIEQFRPDYEIMSKKGKAVTKNSSEYFVPSYDHDEPYFLYVGVMPDPDTAVGKSVVYAFEINSIVCNFWAKNQWSNFGCNTSKVDNGNQVRCECTHFSIFSASFLIPPNRVDPFSDVILFLTITENPLVVGIVVVLLLTYLLLILFVLRSEKRVRRMRTVIVLDDNLPYDKVPYLIVIHTSSRFKADTSSHVGIQVIGTHASSRAHVLACKDRPVLKRSTDDWFLIYCPERLGDVESVHIWHDNSGRDPEWLCEKIVVYDLQKKVKSIFLVNQWLALTESEFPEAWIRPATIEDVLNIKSLFVTNLVLCLRESHVLLCSFWYHPRSVGSRTQKLTILMSSIMVSMCCSLMFYLPKGEQMCVDDNKYTIETRHLYLGIQTAFICMSTTLIIFILNKKGYKSTYTRHRRYTATMKFSEASEQYSVFHDKFIRVLSKMMKNYPLEPTRLPGRPPVYEKQMFWYVSSMTFCSALIIFSSYLVMLYGLKLGLVGSKEWLSFTSASVGVELLILSPLRIVIVAYLVAAALQKIYNLDDHVVLVENVNLIQLPNDPNYTDSVIRRRSQPVYQPLNYERRDEILRRTALSRKRWAVFDFFVAVLTLIAVNELIFDLWIRHLNANSHVVDMMTLTKHEVLETIDFSKIQNTSGLEEYLQSTLVNCLYTTRWYNGAPFERDVSPQDYWTSDCTNRVLGDPEIRQVRVVPKICDNIVLQRGRCISHWSSRFEDINEYGNMWKSATWIDISKYKSPWRYEKKSWNYLFTTYRLWCPSHESYGRGGYLKLLGPTRRDTELKFVNLFGNSWLDIRTRAVFVEFTVYNVNENLFIRITLMVEYLPSGNVLTKAQAVCFAIGTYLSFWNVIFVALIVFYILVCTKLINRDSLPTFLNRFDNVCKLLIVGFGSLSLILFPVHSILSKEYTESFQRGDDRYFEFDSLVKYYVILRQVLSFLQCIAIVHAFSLLKERRQLFLQFHTLFSSAKQIFWITLSITVIMFSLKLLANWIITQIIQNIKDLFAIRKSLENLELNNFQYFHVQFLLMSRIVLINICFYCCVMSFLVSLR